MSLLLNETYSHVHIVNGLDQKPYGNYVHNVFNYLYSQSVMGCLV